VRQRDRQSRFDYLQPDDYCQPVGNAGAWYGLQDHPQNPAGIVAKGVAAQISLV